MKRPFELESVSNAAMPGRTVTLPTAASGPETDIRGGSMSRPPGGWGTRLNSPLGSVVITGCSGRLDLSDPRGWLFSDPNYCRPFCLPVQNITSVVRISFGVFYPPPWELRPRILGEKFPSIG